MPRTVGHNEIDLVSALDWPRIETELNERGYAITGRILSAEQCGELASSYTDDSTFRSQVVMARHGFGRGEYKYFRYPLPGIIQDLRTSFYPHLARVANVWEEALGREPSYPPDHLAYVKKCHAAGQTRPTPLLLKYGTGDYNCLHQDLYGDLFFPLQAAFLLSNPGQDFTGGEFVLVEQRPRMQSRVEVIPPRQGEGVIFAVNQRPVRGSRGYYRVAMRHGVSRLRSGERYTLGVIFHDAK
ncbi:MAG TPA: 2OG-Fe(II) oxygenase [Terriglobales bacterium]|nr:2OG-Fe(II) oxygenase [Terriglobales bacterium]